MISYLHTVPRISREMDSRSNDNPNKQILDATDYVRQ